MSSSPLSNPKPLPTDLPAAKLPLSKLVVLTGPSGVGKGTLLARLRAHHPDLFVSISATTRSPRAGEVNGVNYYFMSVPDFEAGIAAGKFLEWAQYVGNYYGTPRLPVVERLEAGQSVMLEIEVEGAMQVKKNFPAAMLVFILPPSMEALVTRLQGRGTDDLAVVEQRLAKANQEIAVADQFDFRVINDDLDRTVAEVEALLFGEKEKV
ncbi:MAG: guanylate kinase [Anaerolineae bacterium]|nr:guanylate kinase [Gloeobacterales cyanobacterium ES-bin-313]